MSDLLLETRNLSKHFFFRKGLPFARSKSVIRSVDGINLQVRAGQTFGLVGESGCGKSTTARLLLRLMEPTEGEILFDGAPVHQATGPALNAYRSNIQTVFQDPYGSLNPRMKVREIIAEPMIATGRFSRTQIDHRVAELLELVNLSPRMAQQGPHEFSGGQRQRIAIARALALNPRLLILDEPVSALDVSVRAQILNLLADLQDELGLAYFMISHHLELVASMCDWIAVMYLGRIVEQGPARQIADNPRHPYTKALFASALTVNPGPLKTEQRKIEGEVPSPLNPPKGCHFHPRCPLAMDVCRQVAPPSVPGPDGSVATCHALTQSVAA
ncbi:ABC transporter ATP-binding protein [Pararhodobacter zhoushanensis]|uniref:ABC transporter ATP-binding protein n=1 Tax=Pararhodobacter zhoushanensis TaxID=2479545 RepID=UPI000F8E0B21|nr:oligopeptide/dipeptide ABC transporter ATP-binding protein [Pararhodobacter zhoushanensis]